MKTTLGGVAESTKEAQNVVGATANKGSSSGASRNVRVPEGEDLFCRYCLCTHEGCFLEDENLEEELEQKLMLEADCEGFQRSDEELTKEMGNFERIEKYFEEVIKEINKPWVLPARSNVPRV